MKTVIRAEKLSKEYRIATGRVRHDTLYDRLADGAKNLFRRPGAPRPGRTSFWALQDVSFAIKAGEMVGIIGHNGAGKSTLLKILSQITQPTTGRAEIHGRVGSLLEVGTGFHPELTGRENVFLYGAIIGMTKEEIRRRFDAIVAFSEVEKFIDTPVKRYSSGMYVRLAFAVSAHLQPEILLIDEVLSVGDLQFQRKCMAYAEELRRSNATILFVSHNMFTIKAMCNRAILLSRGHVLFDGPPAEAIQLYETENRVSELPWAQKAIGSDSSQWAVCATEVETLDEAGHRRNMFNYGEKLKIRLSFAVRREVRNANISVSFMRSDGVPCCNYNTAMDGFAIPSLKVDTTVELTTPPLKLVADSYRVYVLVRDDKFERIFCAQMGTTFHVRHDLLNTHFGVFHEDGKWFMPDVAAEGRIYNCLGGIQP